ncbi:MAG: alpha/beta fold hydrolase [Gammaproteobacteria bacterium]|nr:alpha/beta fold hydrolase [Gammaproteobacteria bacterium]MBT8152231.1 alpha/beta fold hydrolase [Gammaproteobacteria bacterium]NND40192.1 alpha/beta fold hydrolase [Pseudomonadales bacterium]NNM11528.1 alpha/beta fold hydrolase [Pseudomonadales bacterium]RZV56751.1 MAG: alpha/beta fold hydrolase [Pseudomonadales bacterium]
MTEQGALSVMQSGSGETTVVLLHGLFGNARNLGMLGRALGGKRQILSVDLPGHGNSPHEARYSIEIMAKRVWQTLRARGVERYGLLGHSLGGKVAMAMALAQPREVQRLLVADIAPVRYPPRHEKVFAALDALDLTAIGSRADADAVLARELDDLVLRQFLLQNLRRDGQQYAWRFDLAGLKRDYAALSEAPSASRPAGEALAGPVLFVAGERSNYLLPGYEKACTALFAGAKFERIADAGHWLHAEQPEIFAQIAEKFFTIE